MCVIGIMPRKKFRTARRKAKAKPAAAAAPKAAPTCKRKQWSEESMTAALNEFRKGIHPINKIAVLYGVPKSTLHDRISGRVRHWSFSIFRSYRGTGACRSLDNCSQDRLWENKEGGQNDSRKCC